VTGAYPVLRLGPVRPTHPWARTYRGTAASVPEARRFVGELLAGCPARETLMTCVSELCANAIAHTASGRGGVFTVEVDCPRAGVARVAVTDDGGPSVPAAGRPDLMAEGGRGLAMVAACTTRWGFREAYPGRTVWAEVGWPVAVPSPGRPQEVTGRPQKATGRPQEVTGRPRKAAGRPQEATGRPLRVPPPGPATWPHRVGPDGGPAA
jgi:serine/threonine-protein kinase RsbW